MKKAAIIGSGTMGNGIAHVFAQHGFQVSLIDVNKAALEKALQTISGNFDRQVAKGLLALSKKENALKNIRLYTQIPEGVQEADWVIEAATEDEGIKLSIFKELDRCCPEKTILASNTSSISITKLGAATLRPQKVIGMHFMNPVPIMQLVEVVRGYSTSEEVVTGAVQLSQALGKVPVEVKDYPGFVANRILMPLINEAIYTLYEGVAGVEEIDTVMKLGMAHPMGPLELADFIGLDVCLAILRVLHQGFGHPKFFPCPLLSNLVEAGALGKKSGVGFYKYTQGSKEMVVSKKFQY